MFGLHQKGIFEKPSILVGGAFFFQENFTKTGTFQKLEPLLRT